jgi:phosphatidate cytidylyltransferase
MKTRAITGFFFIIVMLASLLLGSNVFTGFYFLLSILALFEFYKLLDTTEIKPNKISGLILGAVVFMASANAVFAEGNLKFFLIAIPLMSSVFILELYKKNKAPFDNIAYTFLGLFFVIIPFGFFHALGFINNGIYNFHYPLAFLLMLWANDTGAYLFGVKFGKNKLFERHSPKKSWEGFLGGVFTSVLVAFILSKFYTENPFYVWAGMAVIISSFGTLGDLVESMLKRSLNVKDSGNILPGHGGLLDRFDGLLIAAPIVYAFLYLIIK